MLTDLTTCLKRDLWFNVPTDEKNTLLLLVGLSLGLGAHVAVVVGQQGSAQVVSSGVPVSWKSAGRQLGNDKHIAKFLQFSP